MDESVSDSEALGSRVDGQTMTEAKETFGEWVEACAPIRSPPGISGTGHPARVISRSLANGKSARWASLASTTGAPAQRRPGVVGHLRGGFFALLIWRTA